MFSSSYPRGRFPSWKCRVARGASAEKVTAASKVEMVFGVQAEPESGLISLVNDEKKCRALCGKSRTSGIPRGDAERALSHLP